MSQKFIKSQNKNSHSPAHGKYFTKAVYDNNFIETEQLAEFIQTQASVKKSDIKAVLDELGGAMKHFFEMGQKIRLDGIGIFKVGFSSIGVIKQGGILLDWCHQTRGLRCCQHHHPSRPVPARDDPRGSWSGEEVQWLREAEVRQRHHPPEGRRLRRDPRERHESHHLFGL